MAEYVALLRGINVGGKNILKMKELKDVLEQIGLRELKTYIQSGNLVFMSEEKADLLELKIQEKIEQAFGLTVPVIIRSSLQWQQIIQNCPFSVDGLKEGESIHLCLLSSAPANEAISKLQALQSETEKWVLVGQEIYLHLRESFHTSKLAAQTLKLGVTATVRNWKTVEKLETMLT